MTYHLRLNMRKIKLTLEYDGTHFFGYQSQKKRRTVQDELEKALRQLFQKKIISYGSGRTDSGVHAENQVVHFETSAKFPLSKIQYGLNHYLPRDISAVEIAEAKPSFHAQYSAKWKLYEYRVLHSKHRSPLEYFRACQFPHPLNLKKMKQAAQILQGRHDFRAFESSGGRRKNAVRTIRKFEIKKKGKIISFQVEADGFLYKMVRSMVGTLLEIGSGKMEMTTLKKILTTKDRNLIGPTAPAHGLTLKQVSYK